MASISRIERRSSHHDIRQILGFTALLTLALAITAAMTSTSRSSSVPAALPWYEYFAHNAATMAVWVLGTVTFGLSTVPMAILFVITSGELIGAAGWQHASGHLGHAFFELPAFAIALWISTLPWWYVFSERLRAELSHRRSRWAVVKAAGRWFVVANCFLLIAAIMEATL